MPLGLDLRGGLYLLYQVDVNGAVSQPLEGYAQDARRALVEANIPFNDVTTVAVGQRRRRRRPARRRCRRGRRERRATAALSKVDCRR